MNMTRFRELLRRDGWLYAAIALCVVLALSVSAISGSSPDEETRIARVLSEIAGAGSVSVTIYTEDSQPCGAVVVASGAEDIAVRLRLQEAVTTLLGLDSSRVAVYPRKEETPHEAAISADIPCPPKELAADGGTGAFAHRGASAAPVIPAGAACDAAYDIR